MTRPLEGVRILDLSTFVAAPCAGRILADFGAEVIKVEKPDGDNWRASGVAYAPQIFNRKTENPVFDIYNTGKKFVSINLKTPEGLEVFHRLLAGSDVLLTNTRTKALKKLGLAYEDLKDRYPQLIYAQITGFGSKGPEADDPAFDTTSFWARSGFLRDQSYVSEDGEFHPVMPPNSVGDTMTGFVLDMEILAALYQRRETGRGQFVESSLYHTGIFAFGTMEIISQRPNGRHYPMKREDHSILSGHYKCSDGEYVYLGHSIIYKSLPDFARIIGLPDLFDRPEFATSEARRTNRKALYDVVAAQFIQQPVDWWIAHARETAGMVFNKCASYADVANDPQAIANGYVETVHYENGHSGTVPRSPIHMSELEELHQLPSPDVGADTAEVLRSYGFSDSEINALIASGAVIQSAGD